jgi:hypothetical protein
VVMVKMAVGLLMTPSLLITPAGGH